MPPNWFPCEKVHPACCKIYVVPTFDNLITYILVECGLYIESHAHTMHLSY